MKLISIPALLLLMLPVLAQCNSTIPEKKIVIVIPSYNNPIAITRECLQSALMQEYSNFEIIFSDDCSPQPGIEEAHQALIAEIDIHKKIIYKKNTMRHGPIGNQWHIFHSINPDNSEDNRNIIVVNLDGDDVLFHPQALQIINKLHQHAWVTWGTFSILPSKSANSFCRNIASSIIENNQWRSADFVMSHVRTYRLSLLKDLPLEAYLFHDEFFPAAGDLSLMVSLCEKAGEHTAYNPIPVYGYRLTSQNESQIYLNEGAECIAYTKKQTPFQPLQELPFQKPLDSYTCDLFIFSYKRPMQLYALLESIQEHVHGLDTITVLYRTDDERCEQLYTEIKNSFDSVSFVRQSSNPNKDFRPLLIKLLRQSKGHYCLFATDDDLVIHDISIKKCIQALQKTHAYGFYLRLGEKIHYSYMLNRSQTIPNLISIDSDICAWRIEPSRSECIDWAYPNTVDMTIYPKEKIIQSICSLSFENPTSLEGQWAQAAQREPSKIGLCFTDSKIVNIPANKVQDVSPINRSMNQNPQDFIELFEKGFKIDREPLKKMHNDSAHVEFEFTFIKR